MIRRWIIRHIWPILAAACLILWTSVVVGALEVAKSATRQEMQVIEQVNQSVNGAIRPMSDQEQYGVADHAVIAPRSGRGDCEDYALTKMFRLMALGFAPHRLVMAYPETETGEAHAVLIVDRDIVLDNRFSWTQRRESLIQFGYRF